MSQIELDQQLFDFYKYAYNTNNDQIKLLYESQHEIIANITKLSQQLNNRNRNRRGHRHGNNTNTNTHTNTHTNTNSVNNSTINEQFSIRPPIHINELPTSGLRPRIRTSTNLDNIFFNVSEIADLMPYIMELRSISSVPSTTSRNSSDSTISNSPGVINSNDINLLQNFYDRIIVRPSQYQIESSTITQPFSEIENPLNTSCSITLDRFEPNSNVTQIIPCGHIFTPSAISSWFESNVTCPTCRYDIRNYYAEPIF